MIRELKDKNDFEECAEVIRDSFITVADQFNLTRENAPSNPAFIETGALVSAHEKGIKYFGLFDDLRLIGCIAVEKAMDNVYYIERLAVLPEFRHRGYGSMLLNFACSHIEEDGGKTISIGIINEHSVLKKWYLFHGFYETGLKKFDHLPFTVCFMEKVL